MDKKVVSQMLNSGKMIFFYLKNLPGAFFFGLKLESLDENHAIVSLPYRWSTQNPFHSIYFAALAAAAELSTGSIALAATKGKNVSMLVTKMEGIFSKKATEKIFFECNEAMKILAAVQQTLKTGEGVIARVETIGKTGGGVEVARFSFEWSLKKKK